MGLGQKPLEKAPDKKPPNNEKCKLMFFVPYIFFLCLRLTVRICKIVFVFFVLLFIG